MSIRTLAHALVIFTAASATLAAITLPATAAPSHGHKNAAYAITVDGSRASPESVAADHQHIYTTSIADGTVYRGHPGSTVLEPFLPGGQGNRTQAAGIKITGNRLLIAGAFTGWFFIYTNTGSLVSSYVVPDTAEPTLVNDVAFTLAGSGRNDPRLSPASRSLTHRPAGRRIHPGAHRRRPTRRTGPHPRRRRPRHEPRRAVHRLR